MAGPTGPFATALGMFPSHTYAPKKTTFILSFIYTCGIIWPPAPLKSCYLARHLKEVARACSTASVYGDSVCACLQNCYSVKAERIRVNGASYF